MELDQKLYYLARLEITNVKNGDRGEYRAIAKINMDRVLLRLILILRIQKNLSKKCAMVNGLFKKYTTKSVS